MLAIRPPVSLLGQYEATPQPQELVEPNSRFDRLAERSHKPTADRNGVKCFICRQGGGAHMQVV
jgi:cytochrome c peroxidase